MYSTEEKTRERFEKIGRCIDLLTDLTKSVGQEELSKTVREMKFHIAAPFMFVIIGEVKAGKSSFVNALLRAKEDICAVAPSPMTDTIQQIIHGEEKKVELINPFFKQISHPEEILKEISVVDTPGTNTIVQNHEEITERFIPHADLIVFVFEAKNPYRQSAWEFFDYVKKEWHKNVIFVLQQKDLLNASDLEVNVNGVRDHALAKGIPEPKVFAVSAKDEIEGLDSSGFSPLREYLDREIIRNDGPLLKVNTTKTTVETINFRLRNSIDLRRKQYEVDKTFRDDIRNTLNHQEEKTQRQIQVLTENIMTAYDGITNKKITDLSVGLSFLSVIRRSIGSIMGGKMGLKDWLENQAKDFELKLNTSLKNKLQEGIIDVADDIQMMGKLVSSKISTSQNVLKVDDEVFADIAERRANVLSDLQKSFQDFLENTDNFYDEDLISESVQMAPNIAAGSGIAVVGLILTSVVNGAVFDITGGVLTTIGVVFAGASLGWKRRKVLAKFKEEILNGRNRMESEVGTKLSSYTARIKKRIDGNFDSLDLMLEQESHDLSELENKSNQIKELTEEIGSN